MPLPPSLQDIQHSLWTSTLPLEIRLSPSESRSFDLADPYLIHFPRLSYLPFLLPRLEAFFRSARIDPGPLPGGAETGIAASSGWFSYEGVPLRWHWPVGLLYDLFSGAEGATALSVSGGGVSTGAGLSGKDVAEAEDGNEESGMGDTRRDTLSWRLEVHFEEWPEDQLVRLDEEGRVMHDAFVNAVKEADFLRNGTAKGIMSLSKDDSTRLWKAIEDHDLQTFNTINQKLLDPPGAKLRHIPLKIYLPSSASSSAPTALPASTSIPTRAAQHQASLVPDRAGDREGPKDKAGQELSAASLRVVQSLVTPYIPPRNEAQTLGTALHTLLPSLFPSRRILTLARPILHGAVVPLTAPVEELMRAAAYADGWLHLGIVMMG